MVICRYVRCHVRSMCVFVVVRVEFSTVCCFVECIRVCIKAGLIYNTMAAMKAMPAMKEAMKTKAAAVFAAPKAKT